MKIQTLFKNDEFLLTCGEIEAINLFSKHAHSPINKAFSCFRLIRFTSDRRMFFSSFMFGSN